MQLQYKIGDNVIFYNNGKILEGIIKGIYIVETGIYYDINALGYLIQDVEEYKVGYENIVEYVKSEVNNIQKALEEYLLNKK